VRIEADGSQTFIAEAARPRGIAIDPLSGDVFFTEAGFPGAIHRTPFGTDSPNRSLWVAGFHPGDDDPIGLAIAPLDYTGNVVAPGQALMVDEGNGGPTEVWAWSPAAIDCSVSAVPGCADEFGIHRDDGTLLAATDITIGRDGVFLVDWGEIYEVFADGSLGLVLTDRPILAPSAIVVDPLTGDLYVMESGVTEPQTGLADDRILRVDPVTGAVTVVLSGFSFNNETTDTAGLDVSPDGRLLIVTERLTNTVYTFENPLLVVVAEPATSALLLAGLGSCFAVRGRRA
jgi:DNA-binding beta-propeller fold protein YncE